MSSLVKIACAGTALGSVLLALASPVLAQDRVKVEWWYAIGGRLSDITQELAQKFNDSQDQYEVVAVHKGNYAESLAAMVSAYRVGQHPTLMHAAERGFLTMYNSGAIIPVNQVMADNGYDTDWGEFIAPVAGFYVVDGEPAALPFNSSTSIFWYNADQFAEAGFDGPGETWQEIDTQLYALKEQGITECPMALPGDYEWSLIEHYSAIHDQPFGTEANGFDGLDTEFVYNTTRVVEQVERISRWVEDGILHLAGEGLSPTQMFVSGQCATLIASTATHASVEDGAQFNWSATFLPREEGTEPLNSTIGGGAIWVLNNHSDEELAGAAAFLEFVSQPDIQAWWSEQTGYVPVTEAAYDLMAEQGYFQEHPTREIAIIQLSRGEPTVNSRGFRFGNHFQTTEILKEEVEAIWTGQKTVQEALDSAVARGNEVLRQYERLHAGQ